MVNASSTLAGSRMMPRFAAASIVASTSAAMPPNGNLLGEEFGDRDLVGGIEHGRGAVAGLERLPRERDGGKAIEIGLLEAERRDAARSSRCAGPSMRSGHARQWAIGTRMSGEPSAAITEPSRYSTKPWSGKPPRVGLSPSIGSAISAGTCLSSNRSRSRADKGGSI